MSDGQKEAIFTICLVLLVLALLAGLMFANGQVNGKNIARREAVEAGAAYYHPTTGKIIYKECYEENILPGIQARRTPRMPQDCDLQCCPDR